jgi:Fe-S oxidoreductase
MYDVHAPIYWDPGHLGREIDRIYDICHGCRLCFNLCPSFPALFDAIDGHENETAGLTAEEKKRVVDLCYQCKLCYNRCPYTPPHSFNLDFPRLMQRARNLEARAHGVTLQDRALGATTLTGQIGSATAPLSNWAIRNPVSRIVIEQVAGIHRRMNLPAFQRPTFPEWFAARGARRAEPPAPAASSPAPGVPAAAGPSPSPPARARQEPLTGRVALFSTCSVDYYRTEQGKALVQVLEHQSVRDLVRPPQVCCGMPALDGGDLERTLSLARSNLQALAPLVRAGYDVVIPGPTCSRTIKIEYRELVPGDDAGTVAARTFDACEYLMKLHAEKKFDLRFAGPAPGKIAYHVPCHLRDQNMGFKSRDLLALIPGCEVEVVAQCSAMDGTWGMKRQYYELSMTTAGKLFDGLRAAGAPAVASDCPLAALRIEQGLGGRTRHPIEILRDAYGIAPE